MNQQTLPHDTNAALKNIISSVKSLEKIYIEEEKALQDADTDTFLNLQPKKASAAQNYKNYMAQIISRKDVLKTASESMKEQVRQTHAHFTEISNRNLEAIERMQRCTEKLGNTLRNAAIRAAQKHRGDIYGQSGRISDRAQRKSVSSGLNETA